MQPVLVDGDEHVRVSCSRLYLNKGIMNVEFQTGRNIRFVIANNLGK